MPFGNGATSFKKGGFPDSGVLIGNGHDELSIAKLGAGRRRDTYTLNETTIVKK